MEVAFFNSKVKKFFEIFDEPLRSRVDKALHMLERYGNNLGMPYSRALKDKLFELRIIGSTNIRFIYTFYDDKIWILHGFVKKTNKIPRQDLDYAHKQLKLLLQ